MTLLRQQANSCTVTREIWFSVCILMTFSGCFGSRERQLIPMVQIRRADSGGYGRVKLSVDGTQGVLSSSHGYFDIIDIKSRQFGRRYRPPITSFLRAAEFFEGDVVYSTEGGRIRRVDLGTGASEPLFPPLEYDVNDILRIDNSLILVSPYRIWQFDGTTGVVSKIYDSKAFDMGGSLQMKHTISRVALSETQGLLAICDNRRVFLFDLRRQELLKASWNGDSQCYMGRFSDDGTMLAVDMWNTEGPNCCILDVATMEEKDRIPAFFAADSLFVGHDRLLVVEPNMKSRATMLKYDLSTGVLTKIGQFHDSQMWFTVLPEREFIVTVGGKGTVAFWQLSELMNHK